MDFTIPTVGLASGGQVDAKFVNSIGAIRMEKVEGSFDGGNFTHGNLYLAGIPPAAEAGQEGIFRITS